MTFSDINNHKTTTKICLVTSIVGILAIVSIPSLFTQEASASLCFNPHCYAEQNETVTNSGAKFTTIVSSMTPVDSCNDIEAVTEWVSFSNGDYLEEGFTSGKLNSNCYTTIRHYYATELAGRHTEYDVTGLTVGTQQTFEISDTNKDTYWDISRNGGTPVAHLQMVSSSAKSVSTGEEGNRNNPSSTFIPLTHIFWQSRFVGSPGSWQDPTNPSWFSQPGYGYWLSNCYPGPSTTHIHVGTGTSQTCSGTH